MNSDLNYSLFLILSLFISSEDLDIQCTSDMEVLKLPLKSLGSVSVLKCF